jgi:hypothetical protein
MLGSSRILCPLVTILGRRISKTSFAIELAGMKDRFHDGGSSPLAQLSTIDGSCLPCRILRVHRRRWRSAATVLDPGPLTGAVGADNFEHL